MAINTEIFRSLDECKESTYAASSLSALDMRPEILAPDAEEASAENPFIIRLQRNSPLPIVSRLFRKIMDNAPPNNTEGIYEFKIHFGRVELLCEIFTQGFRYLPPSHRTPWHTIVETAKIAHFLHVDKTIRNLDNVVSRHIPSSAQLKENSDFWGRDLSETESEWGRYTDYIDLLRILPMPRTVKKLRATSAYFLDSAATFNALTLTKDILANLKSTDSDRREAILTAIHSWSSYRINNPNSIPEGSPVIEALAERGLSKHSANAAIRAAVTANDLAAIKILLTHITHENISDKARTLAMAAIFINTISKQLPQTDRSLNTYLEIASILLKSGNLHPYYCESNSYQFCINTYHTLFLFAAMYGRVDMLVHAMNKRMPDFPTYKDGVKYAARNGHTDLLDKLLDPDAIKETFPQQDTAPGELYSIFRSEIYSAINGGFGPTQKGVLLAQKLKKYSWLSKWNLLMPPDDYFSSHFDRIGHALELLSFQDFVFCLCHRKPIEHKIRLSLLEALKTRKIPTDEVLLEALQTAQDNGNTEISGYLYSNLSYKAKSDFHLNAVLQQCANIVSAT